MAGAVLSLVLTLGLGLPAEAAAQQPPPPPRPGQPPVDTTRRDSARVTIPAAGPVTDSGRAARIDSVRGIPDTLKTPKPKRDSIQSPIARADLPTPIGVGPLYRWTRDSVYSTAAVNLTDLLERIPGVTIFRSGFLASIQTAAYLGDPARIRVFRDGVEIDVVDSRAGGIRDVGDIQLENAQEILVERAPGEIRVHMRTWTVVSTTPYTRVDAFTGDEDTNLYRFFFGRRFGSGFDAQAGVQQVGTGSRNRRTGGGGNILDAMGRVGWAKKRWSADAVYYRTDRQRDVTLDFTTQDSLLRSSDQRRTEAYVRLGWSDPESGGPWIQGIANSLRLSTAGTGLTTYLDANGNVTTTAASAADTIAAADSAVSRSQYVLTGGYTLGGARLTLTDRMRVFSGASYNTPSARASFDTRRLSVSAFAERNAVGAFETVLGTQSVVDSTISTATPPVVTRTVRAVGAPLSLLPERTSTIDVSVRLAPLSWLAILGSFGRDTRERSDSLFDVVYDSVTTSAGRTPLVTPGTSRSSASRTTTRLEAAIRLGGRLWVSAGAIRRDGAVLMPLVGYECLLTETGCATPDAKTEDAATGSVFGIRGRYFKDVYSDVTGTIWQKGGAYRPQYQLRAETGVQTNWLTRFPSGNFGFKFAIIDEYRSRTYFPTVGDTGTDGVFLFAPPTNVLTAQLEIRIQTGILSYQLRNGLNRQYELVPGFRMPGPVSYYGVRWTFFN